MDAVDFLEKFVATESISGNESNAANFLVEQMKAMNYSQVFIDEVGNAVGVMEPSGDVEGELILLGHMDTVPGKVPIKREGDLLYGRGSVDAKGPLATFIHAVAAKPSTRLRLIVIGAVEEEVASSKGARHVAKHYNPDYCIIGEPSSWSAITLGYKGRLLIKYERYQDMQHRAGEEKTVAEYGTYWWHQVTELARKQNEGKEKVFDQISPALRSINTNSDGLHEKIEACVGLRLPMGVDIDKLEKDIQQLDPQATIQCEGREVAYRGPRTTPLVKAFLRASAEEGNRLGFKVKTGTSDMNVVAPVWKCPIVAYGPGDSKLDHTPNEHISISEYLKAIELLRKTLQAL